MSTPLPLGDTAHQRRQARPALPSTARLLTDGGDARIVIEPGAGANQYGCPPQPDPALAGLGSSTASVVSEAGFAAAEQLRARLLGTEGTVPAAVTYARELNRIRRELKTLCGVTDLPGLEVVFGASGTDLHLIAAQLAAASTDRPTLAIMMDAEETGRGVAAALAGHHFSTRSALEAHVNEGTLIAGGYPLEVANVPIRLANGAPRQPGDIDAEVECLVTNAVNRGWRVLLVLIDVSKTGAVAPSPAYVASLHRRLAGSVEVLVDACQFRIAAPTLRAYLDQEFMVALTGSKFLTGPCFSGALLVPPSQARRLSKRPLPRALRPFCAAADWPLRWITTRALDKAANYGLLLRWEAALQELRAFRAVPEAQVKSFLQAFAGAVQRRLTDDPAFEPLTVPLPDRRLLSGSDSWDQVPTIFPFALHRARPRGGRTLLSPEETALVHRLLQLDLRGTEGPAAAPMDADIAAARFHLGQPVTCGHRQGMALRALRLCASARLIVEATCEDGRHAPVVIERAMTALDKAALLV